MFSVSVADVTSEQREHAKTLQYTLIYSGFDFGTTVFLMLKKLKGALTEDEIKEALRRYNEEFFLLNEWISIALKDWYDNEGLVRYFLGATKRIEVPYYLKWDDEEPEKSINKMRKNQSGRVAINTYGQNSVGLLLKCIYSAMLQDDLIRENTKQHIPIFDAIYMLVRKEHESEISQRIVWMASPIIRHDDFEMQMKLEWKRSEESWGAMAQVDLPNLNGDISGLPEQSPPIYEW